MRNKLLISVATAALITATGFASAQSPGNAPSAGGASQSAPSASPSSPSGSGHSGAGQMNRGETTGQAPSRSGSESGMKSEGGMRDSQSDQMKAGEKSSGKNAQEHERTTGKNAQDNEKASGKSARDNERESGKSAQDNMKRDQKDRSESTMDRSKDGMNEKNATDTNAKSGSTTGQAASGAKLTTEQRTQVRDVITKQHVNSVTNVNFSISVGTRVPRSGVEFHPLPAEVVTIYPDWRGYEFFVVKEQIVVVNPRTLEIVAVLEA